MKKPSERIQEILSLRTSNIHSHRQNDVSILMDWCASIEQYLDEQVVCEHEFTAQETGSFNATSKAICRKCGYEPK